MKTPLPRKAVGFDDMSLPFADDTIMSLEEDTSEKPQVGDNEPPTIQKRPRKPPRNYSYKASTLPKRISHTTEVCHSTLLHTPYLYHKLSALYGVRAPVRT